MLAEKRVRWDRDLFPDKKLMKNSQIWQCLIVGFGRILTKKFGISLTSARYRNVAGHPYVVFTVVHRALFSEEHVDAQFDDIVLELIKQFEGERAEQHKKGIMLDLQDYMFSDSFMSLTNKENAPRYLKLTRYSELTTRIFRDKVAFENWEAIIDELRGEEGIIVLKPNNDENEIFEWRTGRHPKLLRSIWKRNMESNQNML